MYFLLAFLVGVLVLLSIIINSKLANCMGMYSSMIITYFISIIILLVSMIFFNKNIVVDFSIDNFYIYLGGALGIIVLFLSNNIVGKIPAVNMTIFIIVGQLITAFIIELIMYNNFEIKKVLGNLIILYGIKKLPRK
ncbi:uncharacterized membrane protein YdcZ (DUF606 family) [Hypnocyclicus thermotrophus]|uniref:Uncharacterized membrane protein YdcZ (DUF606 family) n=1 Tax=Hypnocyclicus thermotrophus TaxID=1627895 RepID=A0AA46DZJ0_9FUSO|nr:DMT family transporter [Hypnocyclicus thermotrophus]TDT71778.1 uncharacterized membrane protein YdcZ (DUF606 family) [Hypnocyclicus thermotrophus]